jgi:hypothetical protein
VNNDPTKQDKEGFHNVPADLLDEISQEASGEVIGSFFVDAARERLLRLRQKRGLDAGFGAWSDENHPELGTPENTVEHVRSLRNAYYLRLKNPKGALALLHAWADVGDEKIDALIDEIYTEREKDKRRPAELED